jgi:hypothetical protein
MSDSSKLKSLGVEALEEKDYFLKSSEFKVWLKEEKGKVTFIISFSCLPPSQLSFCSSILTSSQVRRRIRTSANSSK